LAKQDEISSTERLLNLIRSKDDDHHTPSDLPQTGMPRKLRKSSAKRKFGSKKNVTLGVDCGKDAVRIALIRRIADKKPVLGHYAGIPYEKGLTFDSPRFPAFLKSVLDDFFGSHRKVNIWSTIPSNNVETRYLRIPKVPKKQLVNTIFWSFKKESDINEKESIFDFEIVGDTVEDGIQKTGVIAYAAPKREVERLKKIFSKAGYPLAGISIVPFALQNLFRTGWTEIGGKNVCTLFIGTDWSRIAIFSNKNLVLCREVKAGLQSMIEAVAEELERIHLEISGSADSGKELAPIDSAMDNASHFTKMARDILNGYIDDDLSNILEEAGLTLDPDDVFQMILPALDRVVQQVERTLEHYYLNYENEYVTKVYISGPICSHGRLVMHISHQLGLSVDYIDPFYTELPGAVDVLSPESAQERGNYVPAIGMALSHNSHTPNFIYTHTEKEKSEKIVRFNRFIFGVSIGLMLICIGYFAWQSNQLDQKKSQVVKLERQLEGYIPRVDQNMILQLATHSFSERQSVDAFANKYKGMAVISEIIKITPSNIRLAGMSIQLGGVGGSRDEGQQKEGRKKERRKKTVLMDGVLFGDRLNFESALAGYMVKLEKSPMFGRPEILSQSFEVVDEKEVLRFTAQVEII